MSMEQARTFIGQARGRCDELEAAVAAADAGALDLGNVRALLVSLRANLRSADVALAGKKGNAGTAP